MINKLIKILLIILFITLPLINSHLLDFFGLENIWKYFYVNWNYEFTKVMFFNIFSGIILFLYFLWTLFKKQKIYIPKIIFPILVSIIISTFFSISPYTSLFWNSDKAHSLVMFFNLIWIYIILINSDNSFKKSILFWSVLWLIPLIYFALFEFVNPSYNYWDLWNRALWTFGHPNYLALYLLLFIPIINNPLPPLSRGIYKKYFYYILLFFTLITLFLTKSVWAIFLFFNYLIFIKIDEIKKIISTKFFLIIYLILFLISIKFVLFLYPEKLHSFVSRFYLWQSTLDIIFSNIKTFFIWNWVWTLDLVFDNFKVPELYIFENFWFTADRPHNIFLNIFYSFWIFWLSIFSYLIIPLLISPFKGEKKYKISLILALIFLFLNYASISSYLVIILIISLISPHLASPKGRGIYIFNYLIIFLIMSISIYWAYNSYEKYKKEIKIYNLEIPNSDVQIPHCENLKIKSAESYFYCWDKFWYKWEKEKAKIFYNLWLKKLPDLWNKNSKYFDNILIKDNSLILHRFYSEKYSNLKEVLKKVLIKKSRKK